MGTSTKNGLIIIKKNGLKILTKITCVSEFNRRCVKSVQIRSFFWSVFSRIRTEYGEMYSLFLGIQSKCREIETRKNSAFGHFSRSEVDRMVDWLRMMIDDGSQQIDSGWWVTVADVPFWMLTPFNLRSRLQKSPISLVFGFRLINLIKLTIKTLEVGAKFIQS